MTEIPKDQNDVSAMVFQLWEDGGTLADLVMRLQQHEQRARALAREAAELRLELTDLLGRMFLGCAPEFDAAELQALADR